MLWRNVVSTRLAERKEATCLYSWHDTLPVCTCSVPLCIFIRYTCPHPLFQWSNSSRSRNSESTFGESLSRIHSPRVASIFCRSVSSTWRQQSSVKLSPNHQLGDQLDPLLWCTVPEHNVQLSSLNVTSVVHYASRTIKNLTVHTEKLAIRYIMVAAHCANVVVLSDSQKISCFRSSIPETAQGST